MRPGTNMTIQVRNQLGKNPGVPGSLLDEEGMCHLKAISARLDTNTKFGHRACCRFPARKSFVRFGHGTNARSALLREGMSLPAEYNIRNTVMYMQEQGAVEPQVVQRDSAKITLFDKNTTWLSFKAGVVAPALHLFPTAYSGGTLNTDCHESEPRSVIIPIDIER